MSQREFPCGLSSWSTSDISARPDSRPFVLQTTFPNKELSDFSETVESAKLQNAVVVQRFT
jgi:UBX domain-containing protein 1